MTEEIESLFVGENLVTWSKKKMCLARVQKQSRAMAHIAYEMIWLKNLLMELDFRQLGPMPMHFDNQSAIYIAQNPVYMIVPSTLRLTVISSEMLGLRR